MSNYNLSLDDFYSRYSKYASSGQCVVSLYRIYRDLVVKRELDDIQVIDLFESKSTSNHTLESQYFILGSIRDQTKSKTKLKAAVTSEDAEVGLVRNAELLRLRLVIAVSIESDIDLEW